MKTHEWILTWTDHIFEGAVRCWEIEEGRSWWQRLRDDVTGRDVREEVIECIYEVHRQYPPDTVTRGIAAIMGL